MLTEENNPIQVSQISPVLRNKFLGPTYLFWPRTSRRGARDVKSPREFRGTWRAPLFYEKGTGWWWRLEEPKSPNHLVSSLSPCSPRKCCMFINHRLILITGQDFVRWAFWPRLYRGVQHQYSDLLRVQQLKHSGAKIQSRFLLPPRAASTSSPAGGLLWFRHTCKKQRHFPSLTDCKGNKKPRSNCTLGQTPAQFFS